MLEAGEQVLPVRLRRDPLEVTPFDGAVLGSELGAEQWLGRFIARMGVVGSLMMVACGPRGPLFPDCSEATEGMAKRLVLVFQCDGENWHLVRPDPKLAHAVEMPDDLEFPETLRITRTVGGPLELPGYEHLGAVVEVCVAGAEGVGCGVFVPEEDLSE